MTRVVAFRKASRLAVLALAILVSWPVGARAQRITGELSGTVADASGGVVPGADVALANEASRATRRTVTNHSGFFAFVAIPAGTYTLTVAVPGFKTHEVTGIELQGGDSRTVRTIQLELAVVAETVSVTAEQSLTPLNSGEKAATLTGEQIQTMPVVGTSAAEVLRVLPGMTPLTRGNDTNRPSFTGEVYGINGSGEYTGGWYNNQSAVGNFTANGARLGLDLTIDGSSGNDPGCNCATSVNPNTEFVQELKVLQSNFGADHAKGPVALSFVSKQGGREFHGSVFGQLRDWHLNSNEWYANKVGAERAKNVFLYPGFTLSGPLLVPGTSFNRGRDRVFFFLGFEYFRQRLDTSWTRSWVPTDAMQNGDFSQAASLGLSGTNVNTVPNGFPGGIVPAEQWDPGGKVLLGLFPRPNADPLQTGGYNYVNRFLNDQNGWQTLARVDVNLSDATKLYARYNLQRERQPFKISLWGRWAEWQTPYPSPMHGDNRSDSVTVGLTHVFDPSLTSETMLSFTYIDFENVMDNPGAVSRQGVGYPYAGVFGESWQIPVVDTSFTDASGPLYANFGGFNPVLFAKKWQWGVQENVTKVWGTHTAKAGLFWEQVINQQPGSNNDNGWVALDYWAWNSTGNTFADLLMGNVTYYYESQRQVLHDTAYHRIEGYLQDSWKVRPRLTIDGGVRVAWVGPGYDRGGNGIVVWDASRYSPDAPASELSGMVWHAKDPSVPTSGVSMPVFVTPRVGFAWDVAGTGETAVRGGFGVYRYADPPGNYGGLLDLAYGVRQYQTCCGTTLRELEGLGGGEVAFGGAAIDKADDQQPRTLSWSLTLDRRLPWSTSLEIGYVGSQSDYQLNSGLSEYNPVPLGAMLDDPYGNADAYRPMPNYGSLQIYRHSAYLNYNALQALVSRQRGRFNFTAAYTFSKNLGLKGADANGYRANASEYAFDPRQYNYGVLGTDRTHVASLSWSLRLPGVKRGGVWQALLGDWQLAGVSSYVSGAPLMGWFGMQGTTAGGVTITSASITGSPDVYAMPVLVCDPGDNVPDGFLFNPACFTAPTPGANGSARQPYIKGQPYYNHDLSLMKNFAIGGGGRKLQLRISAFNVFNHPIRYPDRARNLTLVFDNGVQTNAEFGKLPDDNKYGRRIVQLSARFEF